MRISEVKTFLVSPASHRAGMTGGKNWLFVKVETDDGVVGWGEAYTQLDRDRNIARHVHDLSRYLVGRDPGRIKDFTRLVHEDFAGRRGSMDLYSALSALEQALWDILGKALGVPVHQLLGGACREEVHVYANGWYGHAQTPKEYAERALAMVDRGFDALKFDPFPGPWRLFVDEVVEKQALENVRAVREAVGPDVALLIEGHRRLAPMHALRVGRALEAYDPFWYEEPVPADNIPALAEVRRQLNLPIVTGETLYTKAAFREVFEHGAADIINPDVCNCGGILELKEIAAMAEPYYVAVAPHNYNSTAVGLAATLQVAACIPNFCITEYFVNFEATSAEVAVEPLQVRQGIIQVPTAPGLGIALDEEALEAHPYQQQPKRSWPVLR
ncbi:MAG: mandelate racemase/muconate lactonizing enzyme family protein [Chloroflexota bacterium]|nr:mandelate racemase/muconate lactonizing enzyme family protein [Chloroflexota bacterium]